MNDRTHTGIANGQGDGLSGSGVIMKRGTEPRLVRREGGALGVYGEQSGDTVKAERATRPAPAAGLDLLHAKGCINPVMPALASVTL